MRVLDRFDTERYVDEARTSPQVRWARQARPEQKPPEGDWLTWLILAGRGWGKTRTGAEFVADLARTYPGARIALVAATFADGRDTMVEGESGLLEVLDDTELRGGSRDTAWNRSMGELYLANGSVFKVYSSEKPGRLRGPQHHFAWGDEAAQWLDAHKGTARDTTWSNLLMGLRLPAKPGWPSGYRTRIVVTTTPRPLALLKVRDQVLVTEPERAGIMQKPSTVTTRGRTADNLANLTDQYKAEVIDPIAGTTLARQELDAQIIEDTQGALVARQDVEAAWDLGARPALVVDRMARLVAVDPAVSTGDDSDLTGIVVVGRAGDGNIYVLDDRTLRGTPAEWASAVWETCHDYGAARVVVEDNQGGDMVEHTLHYAWRTWCATKGLDSREARLYGEIPVMPVIHRVHPSGKGQGKWVRAQPIRALYEQGRVKHVHSQDHGRAHLAALEDELTSWTGDKREKSPDRVDALVHGVDYLMHPVQRGRPRYRRPQGTGARQWSGMRGRSN